ncbi:MAG: hypothetical protein SFY68_02885 [Candidatus Sumerlaeia bacterium]|nr:hypothetical protein [Candidatus Sumerlaeia bacterium]
MFSDSAIPKIEHKNWIQSLNSYEISGLVLIYLFLLFIGIGSGSGQRFIVDEACYIEWGMLQEDVPSNWIGMKLIPVVIIRDIIGIYGSGFSVLWFLKGLFSIFLLAFIVGLHLWIRSFGNNHHNQLLCSLIILGTPAIGYASCRLLSEIPSLAFVVWGLALLGNGGNSTKRIRGISAGLCFVGAYFCRTTSFTVIGSFAGVWLVWEFWKWSSQKNEVTLFDLLTIILKNPNSIALGIWLSSILVSHFFSALPVSPFGTAGGHIATHQREIHANVVAFLAPTGVVLPLVGIISSLALCLGVCSKLLLISWLWYLLAASPYLYVWMQQSWVLPRHTTDLVIPLAAIICCILRIDWRNSKITFFRLSCVFMIILLLISIWFFAHFVMNKWVTWYSHGFQSARWFGYWFGLALILLLGCVLIVREFQRSYSFDLKRFILLITLALTSGVGHHFVASSAMGVDRTFVNPFELNKLLESHLRPGDTICSGGPNYERSLLFFSNPDYNWLFVSEAEQLPDFKSEGGKYILLSDRVLIDESTLIELSKKALKSNAITKLDKKGVFTLYIVE